MSSRPFLIGSEIYRGSTYGRTHPLAIPRVSSTLDLIRALGWIGEGVYRESAPAPVEALARFHDPDYIATLQRVEATQTVSPEDRARFNIGGNGNPVYPEVFRRPATACGATLLAVELLRDGGIVYSPGGGTHHGQRARASGFCYFNDPVLGILALLDQGLERVLYIDLDAHHGDGVEAAFANDDRVLTLSVHEAGRWPFTGKVEDRAGGMARNFPVPPGFTDAELAFIVETALIPLARRFDAPALVLQCGADGLADDPMSKLTLSNGALWSAVARLVGLAPRVLVLGGGGYNPWSVTRCWTGIWAVLNGFAPPERLPSAGEAVLRGLVWNRSQGRNPPDHWFTTLADPPQPAAPVRAAVVELVGAALA